MQRRALAVIDRAIQEAGTDQLVVCVSGGTDSTVAAVLASKHPAAKNALMIDTQTGVKEGQEYVKDLCRGLGLDLQIRQSHVSFMDLIERFGVLGAGHHATYFNNLKGRVFRQIGYELAPTTRDRVILISGARRQESARRKSNVIPVRHDAHEKRLVWASPIHDWSKLQCRQYLEREGIPENPVAKLLHRSGECNCPAFMTPDQVAELRLWFPETAAIIDEAERRAKAAGKWHKYGVPVPMSFDRPETSLTDFAQGPSCEPLACSDCTRSVA